MRRLGASGAYRRECGEYVCDGSKLLAEAIRWDAQIRCVLWSKEPDMALPDTVRQYRVDGALLDYVSPLRNCPGVLFSVKMHTWERRAPGRALVLETIQDPGNLGTVLRTANALGMDSVILTGECADLWNPKTVRSAMGALFRQRVYEMERGEMREYLTAAGCRLFGAALSEKSADIRTVKLERTAIAIGSEGRGLSPELLGLCDGEVIIPMNPACESLNAAVAAAIVMWELTKGASENG